MSEEFEVVQSQDMMGQEQVDLVKIFTRTEYIQHHDVDLDSSFGSDPLDYRELFHRMRSMTARDDVTFHVKSYGGDCQMAFALCHYVKQCKAKTTIHIESPSYSMGAILACCGNRLQMNPGTFLMFHNYSAVEGGKGGEFMEGARQRDRWLHGQMTYFCSPFLTADEIDKITKDQDVYVWEDKPGLAKRMKRHFK